MVKEKARERRRAQ